MQASFIYLLLIIIKYISGGTVDITTHEVLHDGNIKEISGASGGNWGGNEVNNNFEELLGYVFDKRFIPRYKQNFPNDWLTLTSTFEKNKRELNLRDVQELKIDVPFGINRIYKDITGESFEDSVNKSSDMSFKRRRLIIGREIILQLFNNIINQIISHVTDIIQDPQNKKLKYILLVGGFGESKMLYNRLNREFKHLTTVISPVSAGLAIIKGAVLFGHNPSVISARIARKTYGYNANDYFIEDKHDPARKVTGDDGKARCKDCFNQFVYKGELLKLQEEKMYRAAPRIRSQESVAFTIFSTDSTNVLYCDDPRLNKLGTITFQIPSVHPNETDDREFEIKIKFGGTEIEVEIYAKYKCGTDTRNFSIDFLSE